ncbi:MAG: hypothetical protein QXT22_01370 [Candidatus Hadarchaeales archaeon]
MSVPPEIAWLLPIAVPFIIGLLVGAVVKKAVKLLIAVVALVVVLIATGAISLRFQDIYSKAMEFLPKIYESGSAVVNVLPYSSAAFLIGLAIGLWKG